MEKKKRDGSPHVDVFMALLNLSLFPHIANIEEILYSYQSSSVFFWAFSLFLGVLVSLCHNQRNTTLTFRRLAGSAQAEWELFMLDVQKTLVSSCQS